MDTRSIAIIAGGVLGGIALKGTYNLLAETHEKIKEEDETMVRIYKKYRKGISPEDQKLLEEILSLDEEWEDTPKKKSKPKAKAKPKAEAKPKPKSNVGVAKKIKEAVDNKIDKVSKNLGVKSEERKELKKLARAEIEAAIASGKKKKKK